MVCEHKYMKISPPPPIIKLATALKVRELGFGVGIGKVVKLTNNKIM
jgi:hypothetical protein